MKMFGKEQIIIQKCNWKDVCSSGGISGQ